MQPPQRSHVILLGGSARAATASAVAAGLEVTAVDRFGDADLREMCQAYHPLSPSEFPLAYLRAQKPSTIVPLGGCEGWVDPIASLGNLHRIAGATAEQWRLTEDLSVLREIAGAAAIGYPESCAASDGSLGPGTATERSSPRWLLKKRRSCGGLGVRWSGSGPIAAGEFYQRWMRGVSLGACYLATEGGTHLLGVCRGLKFCTASHPAIYAGSCGPLRLSPESTTKLVRLGHAAADRLQLRGLFNIDLLWHSVDGFYLLEINPRYTASMELLEPHGAAGWGQEKPLADRKAAGGRSLMAAHLECFFQPFTKGSYSPFSTSAALDRVRCKRVVYTRKETVYDARVRSGLREILGAHSARCADEPLEGTTIPPQHPLLSIFTEADSARDAVRRAAQVSRALRPLCEPSSY